MKKFISSLLAALTILSVILCCPFTASAAALNIPTGVNAIGEEAFEEASKPDPEPAV